MRPDSARMSFSVVPSSTPARFGLTTPIGVMARAMMSPNTSYWLSTSPVKVMMPRVRGLVCMASKKASWPTFQLQAMRRRTWAMAIGALHQVGLEVLRQHAEVLEQRLRLLVEVDEHEAGPALHAHLRQSRAARSSRCLKSQAAGLALEAALDVPGEAVERALELRRRCRPVCAACGRGAGRSCRSRGSGRRRRASGSPSGRRCRRRRGRRRSGSALRARRTARPSARASRPRGGGSRARCSARPSRSSSPKRGGDDWR